MKDDFPALEGRGTPGPWRADGNTVTRRMLSHALRAIKEQGPLTAEMVSCHLNDVRVESDWPISSGSDRAVDVTLTLLKKWGLIRFRKGEGWEEAVS